MQRFKNETPKKARGSRRSGAGEATELLQIVADPSDKRVPEVTRVCLAALGNQLLSLKEQIVEFDRMIMVWHRSNKTSKRIITFPESVPMLATALVASVADPRTFRSGRNFSAWIGLVPKQHSSGGKERGSAASANRVTAICAAFVAGALVVRNAAYPNFKRGPLHHALERTGWLGRPDSNLCILESEFAKTLSGGAGHELAHLELKARPIV
jgi:transposase